MQKAFAALCKLRYFAFHLLFFATYIECLVLSKSATPITALQNEEDLIVLQPKEIYMVRVEDGDTIMYGENQKTVPEKDSVRLAGIWENSSCRFQNPQAMKEVIKDLAKSTVIGIGIAMAVFRFPLDFFGGWSIMQLEAANHRRSACLQRKQLFGRLVCSEHFPELFSDPAARRICDSPEKGK